MDNRKVIYLDDAIDARMQLPSAQPEEIFEFGKWYDFKRGYVLETTAHSFRILKDVEAVKALPSAQPNLKGAKFEIICSQRQTGRTTKLIEKCARYRYALIVCPSRMRASNIFHYARKMGIHIPMPMTFGDFLQGRFAAEHINAFLIDDLDQCLAIYSKNVPIDTVVFEGGAEE